MLGMRRIRVSLRLLVATLIFFTGLAASLAQSGQAWPKGTQDILKLAQANVGDDTIVAYIRNAGLHYKLNPGEIVMLKQQGLSDRVIAAMQEPPPPPIQPPYLAQPPPPPKNQAYRPLYLMPSVGVGYGSGGHWYGGVGFGVGLGGGWLY